MQVNSPKLNLYNIKMNLNLQNSLKMINIIIYVFKKCSQLCFKIIYVICFPNISGNTVP